MRYVPVLMAVLVSASLMSCDQTGGPEAPGSTWQVPTRPTVAATAPSQSGLAEAIEDWVRLLEAGNPAAASKRWASDQEAAGQLTRWWGTLRQCHQRYDYRRWARQAERLADAKAFKVGGHDYGHMHIDWERTARGWRIVRVWPCR